MKSSNNTLLIGTLVLSIGFVMSSKMEMNNQSILSLILIGVSIMCIVKSNRNKMNGEVCFLVAIYLLSNLLSKYFSLKENFLITKIEKYIMNKNINPDKSYNGEKLFKLKETTDDGNKYYNIINTDRFIEYLNSPELGIFPLNIGDKENIKFYVGGANIEDNLNFDNIENKELDKIIINITKKTDIDNELAIRATNFYNPSANLIEIAITAEVDMPYDVTTKDKEQIIQKLKEDNFSGKKRLEFTVQGDEADSISKKSYMYFLKDVNSILGEFGEVALKFYNNIPMRGYAMPLWEIQRTNLVNVNGKNKSTYNIYEPYPGTTLEEMKKKLEEFKNDKFPVSNIKIIEDGEVNIARSNENNNKKLKVKFSYLTKKEENKPHIKTPERNKIWRNSKNYLAEEITDGDIILIIKWILLFVGQAIGVKLKNIHLLGIDHKSTDKNFSVIIEDEDQSKINYIIDTLKILNVPNDGLHEYYGIEIKDIENDIEQVDEIPGAVTLNLNTTNTNKDEIKELISKKFSIDKGRISVKFNESFESSISSVLVQIFPELNDPESIANLEQLAQQEQSEIESILNKSNPTNAPNAINATNEINATNPVTPGLNTSQIAGIVSGGVFILSVILGIIFALIRKSKKKI